MTLSRRCRSASPPAGREHHATSLRSWSFGETSSNDSFHLPLVVQETPNGSDAFKSSPRPKLELAIVSQTSIISRTTLVLFFVALSSGWIYIKTNEIRNTIELISNERDELLAKNRLMHEGKDALSRKTRLLERRLVDEERKRKEERLKASRDLLSIQLKMNTAETKSQKVNRVLKEEIQKQSRREVLEKFGPGPYHVQFEMEIPVGKEGGSMETHLITAEMAPLDFMPHSVNLFLRQISHGMWDGKEIHKNREHILMARTQDKIADFSKDQIDKLSFREHSEEYPHKKYTLGYAGKTGGPNWYFNKIDNSEWHGPGPNEGDEGDACFATVISGKHVVDKMGNLPTNEKDGLLIQPVKIRKATILQ